MERQRYRELKAVLNQAAQGHRDDPRCTHRDATIVAVLLWAALHDRAVSWAVEPAHWPGDLRPRGGLPSQSCMSRRLRHERVLTLIQVFEQTVRDRLPRSDIKIVDGRPLTIGGCSKDPDARSGHGAGHCVRGYKLHLCVDWSGAVDHWLVTPMNAAEPEAAERLIDHAHDMAYGIGDRNYDMNRLYERAGERGAQWIAQPRYRRSGAPGRHGHSPHRRAVWHWTRSPDGARTLSRVRIRVEQVNAWQGHAAIGLGHLPHHVRRAHRVRVWVAIKLCIYHHWLAQRLERKRAG